MNRVKTNAFRLMSISLFVCAIFATFMFAQQGPKPLPAGMKGSDANDPRTKLSAGLFDAGELSNGIKHIALLKKPEAFDVGIDPNSPMVAKALGALGVSDPSQIPPQVRMGFAGLAFANSDLAFQGNHLFLGNFYGINIFDISDPSNAKLVTSMLCPGGQGDVSVYKNLMFMSVEMPNGRLDCGTQGFAPNPPPAAGQQPGLPTANKDRFRGVRIFDISDIRNPKQVGAVQTCRGSHTHTLVVPQNDKDNVYIYVSGTSFVRQSEELAGCSEGDPNKDKNISRYSIDIIKVPIATPQNSKVISSPRIFGDEKTGAINALNDGGSHAGEGRVEETDQCHDITVYSHLGLAAGACSGNGILLDIKDPANPKRIDAVNDKNYAYWHSASFSNDGKKVVFTDEWGGGMGARCRATDPNVWGANAIFNVKDGKMTFANYYKLPAAQGDSENCVAHNGSLIPVPGRDLKIQAWYQGGISIMDFTDAANPMEIAYFDRGPIDAKMIVMGGSWSAYWYNGKIYSSEIARGLDIFELTPTANMTQNEIDAAKTVQFTELNVQNQQHFGWPRKLIVAKALVDQLERSKAFDARQVSNMRNAIGRAEKSSKELRNLTKQVRPLENSAAAAKTEADAARMRILAELFKAPAV